MSLWIPVACTGLYLTALIALLLVAKRSRKWYALAKGLCSALFVGTAVLGWLVSGKPAPVYFGLMLAALLLCASGDVLLGVANSKADRVRKGPFLAGAGFFTLAHGVFCALFMMITPFRWVDLLAPVALMCVMWGLERKNLIRLKKIRPLGYVYTLMVGLMAWKAVATALPIVIAGASLFLISDVILLFLYFGTRRRAWYRTANLTTYYVGVYLLAWSISTL
ncbi:lysoplasmalogenase [Ruminococcaceae bacterium OttesenSCG-928-D13]|nr:lysoplasmalogenase [Ruminococcaceae bacterium OttesenSCG-928-D13]